MSTQEPFWQFSSSLQSWFLPQPGKHLPPWHISPPSLQSLLLLHPGFTPVSTTLRNLPFTDLQTHWMTHLIQTPMIRVRFNYRQVLFECKSFRTGAFLKMLACLWYQHNIAGEDIKHKVMWKLELDFCPKYEISVLTSIFRDPFSRPCRPLFRTFSYPPQISHSFCWDDFSCWLGIEINHQSSSSISDVL